MMEQSNTATLLALSREIVELGNRVDTANRMIVRRDEIMSRLLRNEITAPEAVELMEAADK